MNASEKRAALAGAIRDGQFVVAPGVYDMISAKVADGMGFRALYMTGYGVAASHLGLPDAGIASYAERAALPARSETASRVARADHRGRHRLAARLRRGYGLWGSAQRAPYGAGLRGRRVFRDPARRPGDAQEVRPHARPPRRPGRGYAGEDPGRRRSPPRSQLPDHRAHRCAHEPRPRRGARARPSLRRSRRRRDLHRGAGERGRDRAHWRDHRQAPARQHGGQRQDTHRAGGPPRGAGLQHRHLPPPSACCRRPAP